MATTGCTGNVNTILVTVTGQNDAWGLYGTIQILFANGSKSSVTAVQNIESGLTVQESIGATVLTTSAGTSGMLPLVEGCYTLVFAPGPLTSNTFKPGNRYGITITNTTGTSALCMLNLSQCSPHVLVVTTDSVFCGSLQDCGSAVGSRSLAISSRHPANNCWLTGLIIVAIIVLLLLCLNTTSK
jgi:hypothetical protein